VPNSVNLNTSIMSFQAAIPRLAHTLRKQMLFTGDHLPESSPPVLPWKTRSREPFTWIRKIAEPSPRDSKKLRLVSSLSTPFGRSMVEVLEEGKSHTRILLVAERM
jgi:hypothetical protein